MIFRDDVPSYHTLFNSFKSSSNPSALISAMPQVQTFQKPRSPRILAPGGPGVVAEFSQLLMYFNVYQDRTAKAKSVRKYLEAA